MRWVATTVTSSPSRSTLADRDVLALAFDARLPERDGEVLVQRHLARLLVYHLVLEDEHRVVRADGGLQQPFRRRRRPRRDRHHAREVREPRVERAGVLAGGTHPAALGRPDRDRHLGLPPEHVAVLRHLVDDLLGADAEEVREHDLDHRSASGRRRADRRPHEPGLADGRVADALLAELVDQAARHLEDAAELADVLADHEHVVVALQFLAHREPDGLPHRHLLGVRRAAPAGGVGAHRRSPPSVRMRSANALISGTVWLNMSSYASLGSG
jgi:hypothetical protein